MVGFFDAVGKLLKYARDSDRKRGGKTVNHMDHQKSEPKSKRMRLNENNEERENSKRREESEAEYTAMSIVLLENPNPPIT